MKRISLYFVILFLFLASDIFSQDSIKRPAVKVIELGKNLYEITIMSCNIIASVGSDGVLIVDAGYKQTGKCLKEELEKLKGNDIRCIINTHWHFDHVGGNEILANKNTEIISHEDAKKLLSSDRFLMSDTIKALPLNALPNKTFIGSYSLSFNGNEIDLIPFSGCHSAGDIIVYFKNQGIVHIGDLVFSDMFPFVDYENGGSVYTLESRLGIITDMFPNNIRIIPGHGREYNKEDLKKYKEMISTTINIVKTEKDRGKSIDEIKKAEVLKEWKDWGDAFTCEDWIEIIYNSK